MAQAQVVDINAMFRIGQARHYKPDMTPQFMNIVTKQLGGLAIDLIHEAWTDKTEYLRGNRKTKRANEAAIEDGETADVLTNLSTLVMADSKGIFKKSNINSEFSLSKNKRENSKTAIKQQSDRLKNYKKQIDAFSLYRGNAVELLGDTRTSFHNGSSTISFNTAIGLGTLDDLMSEDGSGNLFLSKDLVQGKISEYGEQLKEAQQIIAAGGAFSTLGERRDVDTLTAKAQEILKKQTRLQNILTHNMGGEDYKYDDWENMQKDESSVIRDADTEYVKEDLSKQAKDSNTGIFDENTDRKSVVARLKQDDITGNVKKSFWFSDDGVNNSLAHNYITQAGGFEIDGIQQDAVVDPFQLTQAQLDASPDENPKDGIADVMQIYTGAMELLKQEGAETFDGTKYTKLLENYLVAEHQEEFESKYAENNAAGPNQTAAQIDTQNNKLRAAEIENLNFKTLTLSDLKALTMNMKGRNITPLEDGTFQILDAQDRVTIIDPKKPEDAKNDLYNIMNVQAQNKNIKAEIESADNF